MADDSTKVYPPQAGEPEAHAHTHEPGGADEVTGLPAAPHAASHISGGDQIQLATTVQKGLMSAAYAGRINASGLATPNTIHVDTNRSDIYVPDGNPAFPYKTIQEGVVAAGNATKPSASNHVHKMPNSVDVGADSAGTAQGLISGHSHTGGTDGPILDQSETHQNADTDVATISLHHTIGLTATTSAAGNHTHAEFTALKWDDLRFPAIAQNLDGGNRRIDYDYIEVGANFQDNARYTKDPFVMLGQFPHSYAQGTDIHPHIHWLQNSADFPHWVMLYRWTMNGSTPGAWQGPVKIDTHVFTYAGSDIIQLSEFPAISGAAITTVSSILDIRFFRDTANASGLFVGLDQYSGNALLKEFDIHFQNDGRGSTLEYSK